jgi:hypothetical protein
MPIPEGSASGTFAPPPFPRVRSPACPCGARCATEPTPTGAAVRACQHEQPPEPANKTNTKTTDGQVHPTASSVSPGQPKVHTIRPSIYSESNPGFTLRTTFTCLAENQPARKQHDGSRPPKSALPSPQPPACQPRHVPVTEPRPSAGTKHEPSPNPLPKPPTHSRHQNLSSLCGKNRSNNATFQSTYPPTYPKIFGRFYIRTWYPIDIG